MVIRRFQRRACTCGAAALLLTGVAGSAAAQSQKAAAPLAVSATVVQTCTVEAVKAPELPGASSQADRSNTPGPTYSIRCGKQRLTYPAPSGSRVALLKGAPVAVALTPDGRAYLVEF